MRNQPAEIKVSEEGGRGVPGARAEVALQPVVYHSEEDFHAAARGEAGQSGLHEAVAH